MTACTFPFRSSLFCPLNERFAMHFDLRHRLFILHRHTHTHETRPSSLSSLFTNQFNDMILLFDRSLLCVPQTVHSSVKLLCLGKEAISPSTVFSGSSEHGSV
jgi:hypothetical protein